jgi:hypothetical protein
LQVVVQVDGAVEDMVKAQEAVELVDFVQLLVQLVAVDLLKLHYLLQQLDTQ